MCADSVVAKQPPAVKHATLVRSLMHVEPAVTSCKMQLVHRAVKVLCSTAINSKLRQHRTKHCQAREFLCTRLDCKTKSTQLVSQPMTDAIGDSSSILQSLAMFRGEHQETESKVCEDLPLL